jgi:hypothetical protein
MECDSAEQMGLAFKRRFGRSLQRRETPPGRSTATVELDRLLSKG